MLLNREDGGRQPGGELCRLPLRDPLVLAISRGGVVTGTAIARGA
jgi:predicted phosphoribosyltransferase